MHFEFNITNKKTISKQEKSILKNVPNTVYVIGVLPRKRGIHMSVKYVDVQINMNIDGCVKYTFPKLLIYRL